MPPLATGPFWDDVLDGQDHRTRPPRRPITKQHLPARTQDLSLLAARRARSEMQWMDAAVLFTKAADAIPDEGGRPNGNKQALRRDAYLCLNRTHEFQAYRERQRKACPRADFSDEWQHPSGELVKMLAASSGSAA